MCLHLCGSPNWVHSRVCVCVCVWGGGAQAGYLVVVADSRPRSLGPLVAEADIQLFTGESRAILVHILFVVMSKEISGRARTGLKRC